jgi:3-oxoadipate enol-lactonase
MRPVPPKHSSSEEYALMPTESKRDLFGFEERHLTAAGTRLRYLVGGQGPPLVLLHGLGGLASNWRLVAPGLMAERRVVIPELPGHGASGPLEAAGSLDPFADAVLAVVEAEDALPAPWVGHSLGGLIALRAAVRRPEAVTGIVLVAAAGISSATRLGEATVTVLGIVQPGRLLGRYRARLSRSRVGRTLVFGGWGVADPVGLDPEMAEAFLSGPPQHADTLTAGKALVASDTRSDLDRVACPCLCLWGAQDNWVPLQDGMEYARRLRAPLRVIADCGHLSIGERPDVVTRAVREFLATVL